MNDRLTACGSMYANHLAWLSAECCTGGRQVGEKYSALHREESFREKWYLNGLLNIIGIYQGKRRGGIEGPACPRPIGMNSSAHSEEGQLQLHKDRGTETVEGKEVQDVRLAFQLHQGTWTLSFKKQETEKKI